MGAGADLQYLMRTKMLTSSIAKTMMKHAHSSCSIWFVCKGNFICTRDTVDKTPQKTKPIPTTHSLSGPSKRMSSNSFLENEATCSYGNLLDDFGRYIYGSELPYDFYAECSHSKVNTTRPTFDTDTARPDRSSSGETFNEHSVTNAETDTLKYFNYERQRNKNVEEDRRMELKTAKGSKWSLAKELKREKNSKDVLTETDGDALKVKYNEIFEKLETESKKNKELQDHIIDCNNVIMGQKNELSDAQMFAKAQKLELEEFWQCYNAAIEEVGKLRQKELASTSIIQKQKVFSEFSISEIQLATEYFRDMIGNGGFGSVYKGQLRNTMVAVKKLDSQSMQGKEEFRHEVAILGKVRHPYIVTLIGACSDSCALIYEFLPNGCLADRLKCKNNTPPLTWRTRTRIAIEICTALIFLHSSEPHPIVHGDLKPQNILLDANLVSKLGDFGICRLLQQYCSSDMILFHQTCKLKGTYLYMDPEYLRTGKLTLYSDVYSYGIVLLQLLTGEGPLGIIDKVKVAVSNDQFHKMIDHTAGAWPYVQAIRLADLGLKCCEINSKNRPGHMGEVWAVLKDMLNATPSPMPSLLDMEDAVPVPCYFFCPITMDIMEDPHFAADGFTYEANAIKAWFDTGNNTSPVTNEILPNCQLITNLALRSDIKEWQQKHQRT